MSAELEKINLAIDEYIAGNRVSEVNIKGVITKFSDTTISELEKIRHRIVSEANHKTRNRTIRSRSLSGGKGL